MARNVLNQVFKRVQESQTHSDRMICQAQEGDSMRIAVSTQGGDLEAQVDSRFGRASNFIVVDTDTMRFDLVGNKQSLDLPQGAGIQSAQNILAHNPDVVLTGNCGPKAFRALQAAGVKVVVSAKGRIADAIKDYLNGKYEVATEANVEGHWI